MPCTVPVTLLIFFSPPSSSDLNVSCHLDFDFKLRFLWCSCASRSFFAPFAVHQSSCYRPSPCQHFFFIFLCGRESVCSLYTREMRCAHKWPLVVEVFRSCVLILSCGTTFEYPRRTRTWWCKIRWCSEVDLQQLSARHFSVVVVR